MSFFKNHDNHEYPITYLPTRFWEMLKESLAGARLILNNDKHSIFILQKCRDPFSTTSFECDMENSWHFAIPYISKT